ncbi:MAG: ribosome-associated translation inhibitor RaiA [Chlorobi bacterium]|nr:MAG: ribosome hibernation promoting factor HPF [Chlorobi bacterium OLB7]MBK8912517.1 ribosome-associated translation inhibitor RaiA [Chlorobiota bacterium]MBX7216324.1 ribosome-associated translation inhibitor RaiA [Candidatus Kapabacteria bacterium]
MNIKLTARHFKARPDLQQFAADAVHSLRHVYDGILGADIVLEDETKMGVDKTAEISLFVNKDRLVAKERTDEFKKSIVGCVDKLERMLVKYKQKRHENRHHQKTEPQTGTIY